MKINELLAPPQIHDSELLIEQQLTESILAIDDTQFEEAVSAKELLAQLGITNG